MNTSNYSTSHPSPQSSSSPHPSPLFPLLPLFHPSPHSSHRSSPLYSADAIASIAFGERCGVVDGNVVRVFSRLRAVGACSGAKQTMEHFWYGPSPKTEAVWLVKSLSHGLNLALKWQLTNLEKKASHKRQFLTSQTTFSKTVVHFVQRALSVSLVPRLSLVPAKEP